MAGFPAQIRVPGDKIDSKIQVKIHINGSAHADAISTITNLTSLTLSHNVQPRFVNSFMAGTPASHSYTGPVTLRRASLSFASADSEEVATEDRLGGR